MPRVTFSPFTAEPQYLAAFGEALLRTQTHFAMAVLEAQLGFAAAVAQAALATPFQMVEHLRRSSAHRA